MKNNNLGIRIYILYMLKNNNKNEYNFLVDKYIPTNINDIIEEDFDNLIDYDKIKPEDLWLHGSNPHKCFFHKDIFKKLEKISKDDSLPHIIFYGNPGTGKKTLINIFLEMIFDDSIYKLDDSKYTIMSSGNNESEVVIKQSDHHIIIEPNNTNFDRYLIQEIVKEYAKKYPLCIFEKSRKFKAVQINYLDNLSYYAQTSLRRTIEKYSKTCRFIMWCYSLSKVIEPLRSRCLCIHIPTQTDEQLYKWMYNICCLEKIKIKPNIIESILNKSNGNLKSILWKLDLYRYNNKIYNSYEEGINKIINEIISIKNNKIVDPAFPINIPKIREYIYKMYVTNISLNIIIKDILKSILFHNKDITKEQINDIINSASEFEYRLSKKRRDIIHLEAFVINIIFILIKKNTL
jgi:replication factor C subunit 3/5